MRGQAGPAPAHRLRGLKDRTTSGSAHHNHSGLTAMAIPDTMPSGTKGEKNVRYGRVEDLFKLAQMLQGTREGLTLVDIQDTFSVSRRTAERMRDTVLRAFPQAKELDVGERIKRWHVPAGTLNSLISISADELTTLRAAAKILRRENLSAKAKTVEAICEKLRALVRPEIARRVDVDFEALTEAEGLAMRPGPRPRVDDKVLANLREAVLACRKVRLHYRGRASGIVSRQVVCPYGFLYGNRHYLVAYSMNTRGYRLFSLPNVLRAEITEWSFERHEFSITEFAANSFGVYQDEPFDVVWEFSKKAAPEAAEFVFHPAETKTTMKNGRLRVTFRAAGVLEMAWHLRTWGDQVKVLAPKDFWARVAAEEKAYWG